MTKRPLSSLDQIKAERELKDKTLQFVKEHKEKRHWSLQKSMSVCLLVASCLLLFFFQYPKNDIEDNHLDNKEFSTISMDINPSFELILNKKNRIINVVTYNDDASSILKDLNIVGMTYEDAIQEILRSPNYLSYITDDAFIQVSVYSVDSKRSKEIEDIVRTYLSQTVTQGEYHCMSVDERTHDNAHNHHMSSGKYVIAQQINLLDSSKSLEDLNNMTMAQLRDLYEELSGNAYEQPELEESAEGDQIHDSHEGMHHERRHK